MTEAALMAAQSEYNRNFLERVFAWLFSGEKSNKRVDSIERAKNENKNVVRDVERSGKDEISEKEALQSNQLSQDDASQELKEPAGETKKTKKRKNVWRRIYNFLNLIYHVKQFKKRFREIKGALKENKSKREALKMQRKQAKEAKEAKEAKREKRKAVNIFESRSMAFERHCQRCLDIIKSPWKENDCYEEKVGLKAKVAMAQQCLARLSQSYVNILLENQNVRHEDLTREETAIYKHESVRCLDLYEQYLKQCSSEIALLIVREANLTALSERIKSYKESCRQQWKMIQQWFDSGKSEEQETQETLDEEKVKAFALAWDQNCREFDGLINESAGLFCEGQEDETLACVYESKSHETKNITSYFYGKIRELLKQDIKAAYLQCLLQVDGINAQQITKKAKDEQIEAAENPIKLKIELLNIIHRVGTAGDGNDSQILYREEDWEKIYKEYNDFIQKLSLKWVGHGELKQIQPGPKREPGKKTGFFSGSGEGPYQPKMSVEVTTVESFNFDIKKQSIETIFKGLKAYYVRASDQVARLKKQDKHLATNYKEAYAKAFTDVFKKLVLLVHPDRSQQNGLDQTRATELFKELSRLKNEALKTLESALLSLGYTNEETVEILKRDLSEIAEELRQMRRKIEELQNISAGQDIALANIEKGLRDMQNELKSGLKKKDKEIEKLKEGTNRLEEGMDRLEEGMNRLEERKNRLEESYNRLEGDVAELKDGLATLLAERQTRLAAQGIQKNEAIHGPY